MLQNFQTRLFPPRGQRAKTSALNKRLNTLVLLERHSEDGINLATLAPQEHPEINASTTSTPSSIPPETTTHKKEVSVEHQRVIRKILSMPESLPPSSKGTWNVRFRHSLKNSVDTEWFRTWAAASTSRGQDFRSLSSVVSKEMLDALWLPTATDFAVSPLTSSNSFSTLLGSNSLFSTTMMECKRDLSSEKTSWPSFMSSPQGITAKDVMEQQKNKRQRAAVAIPAPTRSEDEDDLESSSVQTTTAETTNKRKRTKKSATLKRDNKIVRCVRIPVSLYPPSLRSKTAQPVHQQSLYNEKREVLNRMFGIYRHIYNTTVEQYKEFGLDVSQEYEVRQMITALDGEWSLPFYAELPTASKQKAVTEFFTQLKTNLKKGGKFEMKFKSKLHSPQQCLPYGSCKVIADNSTIVLPYNPGGNKSSFKEIVLFMKQGVPEALKTRNDTKFIREEVKILRSRNGNLHVVIPITLSQHQEDEDCLRPVQVVSMDPGVRTFQTFYTPDGRCGKIGTSLDKVFVLLHKIDKTISKLSKPLSLNAKKRRRLKRSKYRQIDRVKNVRDDFHRKTCVWLLRNFDFILLPALSTKQVAPKLSSKTCRAMYTWSHYAFKQRLLDMSQKYTHKKVIIVDERFTTMTCGKCFTANYNVGASKVFSCAQCGLESDRDVHAARNILLRYVPDLFVLR